MNGTNACALGLEAINDQWEKIEDRFAREDYCRKECEFYGCCYANTESCIKEAFACILDSLTPKESIIVKLVFGYNDTPWSRSSVASLLDISEQWLVKLEQKSFRKLRHPTRSKKINKYRFAVIHCAPTGFYASILKRMYFGIENEKDILMGINLSMVDMSKLGKVSPKSIEEMLNKPVSEFESLTGFEEILDRLRITTLNHLLYTNTLRLLEASADDVYYFSFKNAVNNLGFIFVDDARYCAVERLLHQRLFSVIFNQSALDKKLMDLPLSTTLLLVDNNIITYRDLLECPYEKLKSAKLTSDDFSEIGTLLWDMKLEIENSETCEIHWLSESGLNRYVASVIKWMISNHHSVLNLVDDLLVKKLYWFNAVSYINKRFSLFDYFDFYSEPYFIAGSEYSDMDC